MSSATSRKPRIVVFDSGVGGLSIAQAIKKTHQSLEIVYVSDNAAFPYGTRGETTLIERTLAVLGEVQRQYHADVIVIACNTASTVALPSLRKALNIPIVGVVPAIKPAAVLSTSKVIGLLATPGTVARRYTEALIEEFADDCQIIPVGSAELVKLAEDKLHGESIDLPVIEQIVEPFTRAEHIDTVVLACTHFPLLLEELKLALPKIHHWVDSGDAIARRITYWLAELGLSQQAIQAQAQTSQQHCIFTEQTPALALATLSIALKARGFDKIDVIPMPFVDDSDN